MVVLIISLYEVYHRFQTRVTQFLDLRIEFRLFWLKLTILDIFQERFCFCPDFVDYYIVEREMHTLIEV